jgi:CelD/BcsL family acetyltransferase involved in cellulose biosynthesis
VWDALLTPDLSLFQSYRWNRLAAEVFGDREQPQFIFAENDNGAAILPAVVDIQEQTIRFAGEQMFDYRDYLARGDSAPAIHAWNELIALNLPTAIKAIRRPTDPIWNRLPQTFFTRAPRLSSNAISADELTHSHSRAFRRLRKLGRMEIHVRQYSGDSRVVRQIYELRARQANEGELFHDPRRVEFIVAACRQEGSRCEIFTLEHGSSLAAALVTFRDEEVRRFYTIYYDHAWRRFSPGISLLFEVSRRTSEQRLSFDFMTGEQAYKMRIADEAEDLFEVKASALELREAFSEAAAVEAA